MTIGFLRTLRTSCATLTLLALSGCYGGTISDGYETIQGRSLEGIARESSDDPVAVERVPRDQWGNSNTAEDLSFEDLSSSALAVLDPTTVRTGLGFFINEHTSEEGVGPVFNQTRCLGCHENSVDNSDNGVTETARGDRLTSVASVVARAHRHGPTDYDIIRNLPPVSESSRQVAGRDGIPTRSTRNAAGRPDTAAFTLFGDFNVGTGIYNPLPEFGGPVQHIRATEGCPIDELPPREIDPNLSAPLAVAARGERAGPSYAGRGLMEAIYWEDLAANGDPFDEDDSNSTLDPQPDQCPGDCISGRPNFGHSDTSFTGGSPIVRLARFGLRGAGPALLQFIVGGIATEIGLTTPLAIRDLNTPLATHLPESCDNGTDPEFSVPEVISVRAAVRLMAVPEFHDALMSADPDGGSNDEHETAILEGAALFGVDFEAFQEIMLDDNGARGDTAIAADRQLNCVGCHIPIHSTGKSPAEIGADHLSDKFIHLFSDLLIHDMGGFDPLSQLAAAETRTTNELSRNLADFALPGGQGIATGREWRTPPLWATGRIGPPFLHDGRVYVNPDNPATLQSFTVDGVPQALTILTIEDALRAAIELHDMPAPPDNDYTQCPDVPAIEDICSRESPYRSEARNVIERWRLLTEDEQLAVVAFLLAI